MIRFYIIKRIKWFFSFIVITKFYIYNDAKGKRQKETYFVSQIREKKKKNQAQSFKIRRI
jgi:hypothetical protein